MSNSPRLDNVALQGVASQNAATAELHTSEPECGWYRVPAAEAGPGGPNLSWCHAPAGHPEPYHLSTYAERVPEDDPRLRRTS